MTKQHARLPTTIVPEHYDLTFTPDLKACTFKGTCLTTLVVKEATDVVILNANELTVHTASVLGGDRKAVDATKVELDEHSQVLFLHFAAKLLPGTCTLEMTFDGILNDKMCGFYASKYTKPGSDEVHVMATTQFEATDARRAFPCWDEPAFKATFRVTLVSPKHLVSLSNMPVVSQQDAEGDCIAYTYDTTPKMSTYLLAFIIGEFDFIESKTSNGTLVRVYTPLGKQEQGRFALDAAVKCLEFYNSYFEIPYPLPKLDLIAIPDFSAGAMENWGLVTYRSTALLIDEAMSSASTKQWVALVVAHELAHQWFGNLVTMEWWTHLWLNEGFASWVEYLAVDELFPEWGIWTQFVYQDFGMAMKLDSLKSSHPVEVPVGHADEVDEIFDAISYSKGASIIRMLVRFLGNEDFRKGMVLYLNRFKYQNASTEDLWQALTDYSKKPVKEFMDTWTKQTGYPVLTIQTTNDGLHVSQKRFLMDGGESEGLWHVPMGSVVKSGASILEDQVLKTKQGDFALSVTDWVKVNSFQTCMARVMYDEASLEKLCSALSQNELKDPLDRLGIQNDLFALAKAGLIDSGRVLAVLKHYNKERNYTVWADIASNMSSLYMIVRNTDFEAAFKAFYVRLLEPILAELGWDPKPNESHLDNLFRSLVIPKLIDLGHEDTVQEALRRFDAFCASKYTSGVIPDLRCGVYRAVMASRGRDGFEQVCTVYRNAEFQEERVRCLKGIGATTDDKLVHDVLEFGLSNDVRSQDLMFVFYSTNGSLEGLQATWAFLKANWDRVHNKVGSGPLLSRFVKIASGFATDDMESDARTYFSSKTTPAIARSIEQTLEAIQSNSSWLKRDRAALQNALSA